MEYYSVTKKNEVVIRMWKSCMLSWPRVPQEHGLRLLLCFPSLLSSAAHGLWGTRASYQGGLSRFGHLQGPPQYGGYRKKGISPKTEH